MQCPLRTLLPCFALLISSVVAADDIDQRLQRAEEVKRASYADFVAELAVVEASVVPLTPAQRAHLDYLRAWQSTYAGNYDAAISSFGNLIEQADDPVLRFRSRVTLVNALTLARRYPASFEQLAQVLEQLDSITDPAATAQALGATAQLLNQVAQYSESLRYSTRLLEVSQLPWVRCGAAQLQYESKVKSGLILDVDLALQRWVDECSSRGEQVFAGLLRTYVARLHMQNQRPQAAIEALMIHQTDIRGTRYPFLIADAASKLASAHLALGQYEDADVAAQEAIAAIKPGELTESVAEAWRVAAAVAEKRGDLPRALEATRRYQEVDRAYLDDVGQRALAFEMARHQARAKSLEIAALNQQNQLLQLQQQIGEKTVQSARLSILLLLTVLATAIVWALRSRRMHKHFQRLAQNDALTQAASRMHFMHESERTLEQLRRSGEHAAIVLLDLDFFKQVNDQYGHAVGDDVLRQASAACRAELGDRGMLGRLGGEEFAFLLPRTSRGQAVGLAERCRVALNQIAIGSDPSGKRLSGSFGVASTPESGYDLRQLLIDSDAALYRAKGQGRNRVEVYSGQVIAASTPM